jgi:hypothetical protein
MKSRKSIVCIITLAFALIFLAKGLSAQSLETVGKPNVAPDYSQLAMALEQSGINYQKLQQDAWQITIPKGKDAKRDILIIANQDVISFLFVIGNIPEKPSTELTQKLGELNNAYYFVKFISDKKNLYLRIDAPLHTLDGITLRDLAIRLDATIDKEGKGLAGMIGLPTSMSPSEGAPAPMPSKNKQK